jgi:hypothetical protein
LTVALLDLLQLPQKIPNPNKTKFNPRKLKPQIYQIRNLLTKNHSPKLGLGANLVGGPELHAVNLGVLIGFSW